MKKCIHPIKATRAMKNFIKAATTLTYEEYDWGAEKEVFNFGGETFEMPPTKMIPCDVEITHSNEFATLTSAVVEKGTIKIYIDKKIIKNYAECFNCLGFHQVRSDAVYRYPFLKGFSIITFVLLHELGHNETDIEADKHRGKYSRDISNLVHEYIPKKYWNYFHAENYKERLATDWAANWLKVPANRNIAKQFEKEFFACYKDE